MAPAVDSASGLGAARGMAFLAMADLGRIRRRTLPDGQVRFFLDFRPHGRVFSIPTDFGPMPLADEGTASRLLEGIRARVADGVPIDGALAAFQRTAASHVLQRVRPWLALKQREADAGALSPESVRGIRSDVARHWAPFWKGISIHEVKRAHLDDWRMELLGKLGPATARNVLAYFRAFLRWLEDRGEIRSVPRFPTVTVPQREGALLTFAQQEAVLAQIEEERRGIFLALVDLALRPNEARAALAIDYEREELGEPPGWLIVQRAAKGYGSRAPVRGTKTGAVKRVPVTDRLAGWIEAWVPRDARLRQAPLFVSPRGGMSSHSALQREWQRACVAAGVLAVGLRRGTRHSTATGLRRVGVPVDDIQRFLGHANVANTERYSRWSEAALLPLVRARFER